MKWNNSKIYESIHVLTSVLRVFFSNCLIWMIFLESLRCESIQYFKEEKQKLEKKSQRNFLT